MLMELWERLRGYDKWVEAEATISSSKVQEVQHTDPHGFVHYTYPAGDVLMWTDQSGEKQYATFDVPDDSPLYQLVGGEGVRIRYNPADPTQFYYRDLLKTRLHTFARRGGAALLLLVALGVFYFWLHGQSS
jgi:hypothetical protein